jgi:hypothetical protein
MLYIRSIGGNTKQIMEDVTNNMDQMNRFQFENGVKGLTKMAAQASMLRFDMNETFKLADKVLSPEGAIQLNDKDTIIAGTDLEGKKKTQEITSSSTSVDIGPLVQEMAAVKNLLGQLLSKDTNVYMDSTKVGEALRVSAVKIN